MHDFFFTIPDGMILIGGGFIGYMKKGSIPSFVGGAGTRLVLILTGYLSLKAFEKKKNSSIPMVLQTGFDRSIYQIDCCQKIQEKGGFPPNIPSLYSLFDYNLIDHRETQLISIYSVSMAENMTSHRRKPQSLNDRNYHLLQDLSAPPKQPPSSHGEDEETKKSIFKLAGRRRLCKAASPTEDVANEDDDPDLADLDSPVKGDISLEGAGTGNKFTLRDETKEDNTELADEPSFSIITDFVSPSPQEKQKQEKQHDGGKNEIMDILEDLTSKLGTMSIQKKKNNQSNGFRRAASQNHTLNH